MAILNLLRRLFGRPTGGIRRLLRTEERLVRIAQQHTRQGRDLRHEIEQLDRQIANKRLEVANEPRPAVLAVLRAELHALELDLRRRATRIAVLTDQRNHVANLLEKLQVAHLAVGSGAVAVTDIDAITTEVENAAAALDDRRLALQDLDANSFASDYTVPTLQASEPEAEAASREPTALAASTTTPLSTATTATEPELDSEPRTTRR